MSRGVRWVGVTLLFALSVGGCSCLGSCVLLGEKLERDLRAPVEVRITHCQGSLVSLMAIANDLEGYRAAWEAMEEALEPWRAQRAALEAGALTGWSRRQEVLYSEYPSIIDAVEALSAAEDRLPAPVRIDATWRPGPRLELEVELAPAKWPGDETPDCSLAGLPERAPENDPHLWNKLLAVQEKVLAKRSQVGELIRLPEQQKLVELVQAADTARLASQMAKLLICLEAQGEHAPFTVALDAWTARGRTRVTAEAADGPDFADCLPAGRGEVEVTDGKWRYERKTGSPRNRR